MTKRMIAYWVIPPEADAEFVAGMEDVLATYAKAYDPTHPVLCMDEQPVQLLRETRPPLPATPAHPARVDYAYERAGTASLLMCAAPRAGCRHATARPQRTTVDWAFAVAQVLDTRYAHGAQRTRGCDHLNTSTTGAFYEAFEPERARAYLRRLAFCSTPKPGSWLHSAACARSGRTRPGLRGRRLGALDQRHSESRSWSDKTHATQRGVDWQLHIDDARQKLKRLYPKIKT